MGPSDEKLEIAPLILTEFPTMELIYRPYEEIKNTEEIEPTNRTT
jgi:hypothetical protein